MLVHSKGYYILIGTFLLATCGLVSSISMGQTAPEKALTIQDGTIIHVVLTDSLGSNTSHANDPVHFEAAEDVKVGDVVVIAKGAAGVGHVITAEKNGHFGKSGGINYSLDYIKAVDGTNVRLRASSSSGNPNKYSMLGIYGAFKHGKKIKVAKGTRMDAYVDGDREIHVPGPGASAPNK
ncbi:MAG TPA: hypothetical protein VMX16_17290 [Terriglobia bacterium]|nr:hypothetical protein [Terriglobia bacterium]